MAARAGNGQLASMDMESQNEENFTQFLESGIYVFEDSNAVFVDPVRVLNRSYNHFKVSPSVYYARFFESQRCNQDPRSATTSRKGKRKRKQIAGKPRALSERERIAEQRHLEARSFLLKAQESLQKSTALLDVLSNLRNDPSISTDCGVSTLSVVQQSFVELGQVWQVPLFEITLNVHVSGQTNEDKEQRVHPAFNNLIANETTDEAEAEFLNNHYIIPRESCFYMSDMGQIHSLVPADADSGFNLIVVDPPWENASAHQKSRYPTLPNRYFLSLPIIQLTHTEGALVALWVTNREKLRGFVERELFPAWGVSYAATFYWLKVKANGSLISDLDLFHHRPYESLILGYSHGKATKSDEQSNFRPVRDNYVIMSIPGDYSRKPPIADLLMEYVPGLRPARCIELFAREMIAGWVSWGNEPLHFQDCRFFLRR
ncbi:methyltransferase-like protein 2 isoform X2 [Prosopis cineraria]|uniref:methyltransferase-like protein 2 isoform X2 n=1 Tax=Prosopis cineraria TaxID=364024 RepID=UPI00240F5080|nr:methyltransferase-like protein 2 isoform X2 [Prosopis cineraria]